MLPDWTRFQQRAAGRVARLCGEIWSNLATLDTATEGPSSGFENDSTGASSPPTGLKQASTGLVMALTFVLNIDVWISVFYYLGGLTAVETLQQ